MVAAPERYDDVELILPVAAPDAPGRSVMALHLPAEVLWLPAPAEPGLTVAAGEAGVGLSWTPGSELGDTYVDLAGLAEMDGGVEATLAALREAVARLATYLADYEAAARLDAEGAV